MAELVDYSARLAKPRGEDDDDLGGEEGDAFRTRRGSHCLLLHTGKGKAEWFPYPANDCGTLDGKTITLEFSAATVTIEGTNLMPLVLALADYRAASVRVAPVSVKCATAITSIEIERA